MKLYNFSLVFLVLLLLQSVVCVISLIAIPTDIGHWSYRMHARARIARNTHFISFLLLLGKAIMVPIGFSYYKSLDASCTASYNYLYEVMYVIIMIYMVSFTLIGAMTFFWVRLIDYLSLS